MNSATMMLITEAQLRRIIREELEDYSILSEAALKPATLKEISPEATFKFSREFDSIKLKVVEDDGYVLGTLHVKKVSDPRAACLNAWEVTWSKVELDGLGPLMYDAMMEFVSPDPIMSDRDSVTNAARNVWKYYFNSRSDVDWRQLDNEDGIITPDDKRDDCKQWAAYFGDEPDPDSDEDPERDLSRKEKIRRLEDSPLAKAYSSRSRSTLDALTDLGMMSSGSRSKMFSTR